MRFPRLEIVGVNIDFAGPHALAGDLVARAGVSERCRFVCGDARRLPFAGGSFDSVSCFLGLQDIGIGFGARGVEDSIAEMVRVLKPSGHLAVAEEYSVEGLRSLLQSMPLIDLEVKERAIEVRWTREVAEQAISLYAEGWASQVRTDDLTVKQEAQNAAAQRLTGDLERQIEEQGFHVPFGPVRLATARKGSRRR
jgi:ubiquinone/menaquinone biosynthesis C-methylase UbiE